MAWRSQLQAGETLLVQAGHAVDLNSVVFYAQDSEQAGMLGRAQEIENLEKQLRAQTLISEESRSALVRAEAAYADASQRLITVRREASESQSRTHELQVETLRLSQLVAQTRARSEQINNDWPKLRPCSMSCKSAVSRPKPALKSWTCSWPTPKSATPSWTNV